MDNTPSGESEFSQKQSTVFYLRLVAATFFVGGIVALSQQYGSAEILDFLAQQENRAEQYRADHPVAVFGVAFLIYATVTGLSLPGAAVLTILFGWFFGFLPALVVVSFASTTGATLAFLISRYFLRDSIQKQFGERLRVFNEALEKEGASYLLTLRLIPAVPFFIINLVMGLTPIRVTTFWWVSQLGMLPGTAVFTYAGSSFPEIAAIQSVIQENGVTGLLTNSESDVNLANMFADLIVLGLFPIALKFILKLFRKTPAEVSDSAVKE